MKPLVPVSLFFFNQSCSIVWKGSFLLGDQTNVLKVKTVGYSYPCEDIWSPLKYKNMPPPPPHTRTWISVWTLAPLIFSVNLHRFPILLPIARFLQAQCTVICLLTSRTDKQHCKKFLEIHTRRHPILYKRRRIKVKKTKP